MPYWSARTLSSPCKASGIPQMPKLTEFPLTRGGEISPMVVVDVLVQSVVQQLVERLVRPLEQCRMSRHNVADGPGQLCRYRRSFSSPLHQSPRR